MKECVTHHHACDCREEKFAKLEADLAAAQMELAAWEQVITEEHMEWKVVWLRKRVAELLAQEGVPAQPQYRVVRDGDKVRFI